MKVCGEEFRIWGLRVQGSGFGAYGGGFRVGVLGFEVSVSGFINVQGLGLRVESLFPRVHGLSVGCRVHGSRCWVLGLQFRFFMFRV